MNVVYDCLTRQHDPVLVVLAVLIGFAAAYTALGLFVRAMRAVGTFQVVWLAAAAAVAGSGVWTTHFIAMLAYRPGFPVGYDLALTLLSVVLAIGIYALGFAVALRRSRRAIALGCGLSGLGISVMHWTGMQALIVPAQVSVSPTLIVAAALWGIALSVLGGLVVAARRGVATRMAGAALFALAVGGMHFTGMGAMILTPDPLVVSISPTLPVSWLAGAVAAMALAIVGIAALGAAVDDAMIRRARQEASRLRAAVTELEKTRADLSAALDAASAGSRAKSQFLAAMSHELRTPLNAIIGFAEIMERQILGPLGHAQYVAYAGDMGRSGAHLLRLVNGILDYSRIDASHMELDETELAVGDLVARAARQVEAGAHAGGIAITVECGADLPLVRGDAARLDQVLLHLLDNAIKFSPRGDTVRVSAWCEPDGLHIDIADSGIGMTAEQVAIALEPFAQVDGRLERKYEGMGLGLSLARRLVERHGGRIDLRSRPGHGTTVALVLPPDRLVTATSQAA